MPADTNMEYGIPHTTCPYCQSRLRRVPGMWLNRGGFECERCGEFIDFSRELTEADGSGKADEEDDLADRPAQSL